MRGINYMVFTPESMAEIVEDYVRKNYGWDNVEVESVQQKKHHNARMFEAKLLTEKNERNITDGA